MLLYLPMSYIAGMLCWLLVLVITMRLLLVRRRRVSKDEKGQALWVNGGLSLWMLLALLTGCELYFALFVDESDGFNMTNVSKRWFARHIEGQRNRFAARDVAEFRRRPPDGRRRICFFGDSFTIGHGVPRCEDRFSDRVGAALERARPGEFQVANLADPGLEISQIEARVHGILKAGYQMDMVVYVICLNDIEAYDPRTQVAIDNIRSAEPRFFLLTKTYFLNWLYFRWLQAAKPGARDYFPHLVDSYNSKPWDGFSRKLKALQSRCIDHDSALRVVIFPFLTHLGDDYSFTDAHRKIVEYCRELGIAVLDLEPTFRKHASESLTVNRFDSHPNERAHQIAADAILTELLNDFTGESTSP